MNTPDLTLGRIAATVLLPLHSLDWGVRLVLSLTGAAVVLDPPELGEAVAAAAGRALASYPWAVT